MSESLNSLGLDSTVNLLLSKSEISNLKASTQMTCKWADCGKSFAYLDDLATHVSTFHSKCGPGGLFYCRWDGCSRGDKGFNARYKMLVHVRTHTNEKPHQCLRCHKSFSRAENLKIHARSHTGERPYICPIPGCGKAYSNSSDRFKHTRTHSVHKPYMCKIPNCGKSYTDPSSLRKHVKTYRHFPSDFPLYKNSSKINVGHLKIGDTDTSQNNDTVQVLERKEISDSCLPKKYSILSHYGIGEADLTYNTLKKWLRTESLIESFSGADEFTSLDTNCVYFKEQDKPLDLTIRKR